MKRLLQWLQTKATILIFSIIIFFICLFALFCSIQLPKGGVWFNHLQDGLLFLKGSAPEPPAYPMWGYSLLAGLLKDNIIIFQFALLLAVCIIWYASLLNVRNNSNEKFYDKLAKSLAHPVIAAMILAPYFFLCVSYFSNSIAYMLTFCGTWILYFAAEKEKPIGYYIASSLLIGLAFNFRSEVLTLGMLLFLGLLIYSCFKHISIRKSAVFLLTLFMMVLPWIAYTSLIIKQPQFSSTNGGAVMYLGLGVLPDNPWGIIDSDGFVGKVANEKNLGSPWSNDANKYFTQKYIQSIREHPKSFAQRVALGWRQMLTQGLYFPDFRTLLSSDGRDDILFDYVNEKLKLALGLNVNDKELEEYRLMGIDGKSLSLKHYVVVFLEYSLRFIYTCIFLLLIGLCLFLAYKTRLNNFAAIIFLVYLIFLLFCSGFIQTDPRHTTIALPIFLFISIMLSKSDDVINKNESPQVL